MHKNHFNPKDKPYRDQPYWLGMGVRRQFWANYQNRRRRYRDREFIFLEEYEKIRTLDEPRDWWLWD